MTEQELNIQTAEAILAYAKDPNTKLEYAADSIYWTTYPGNLFRDQFNLERGHLRIAPAPDYTKDQGFKLGDIVMVSNDGKDWGIDVYSHYSNRGEAHIMTWGKCYQYARPLTKQEVAERVRVQE